MFSSEYKLPKTISLSPWEARLDFTNPFNNIIQIDKIDFVISYLNNEVKGNKGGNSYIFTLSQAQNFEDGNSPEMVIKICKSPLRGKKIIKNIHKRFEREVIALFDCKEKSCLNVIDIFNSGILITEKKEKFLFYTMEYGESDLKTYLSENTANIEEISLFEKINLCLNIAYGIQELNDLGYYHRDIKPDNIFIIGENYKIGDLGLVEKREEDSKIDEFGQFIGPRGWTSPEAMNKYLCESTPNPFNFEIKIDHKSDIFQLGMVFWYILQGNAPIGSVRESDFNIKEITVYPLLRNMINHNKNKRPPNINQVILELKRLYNKVFAAVD